MYVVQLRCRIISQHEGSMHDTVVPTRFGSWHYTKSGRRSLSNESQPPFSCQISRSCFPIATREIKNAVLPCSNPQDSYTLATFLSARRVFFLHPSIICLLQSYYHNLRAIFWERFIANIYRFSASISLKLRPMVILTVEMSWRAIHV